MICDIIIGSKMYEGPEVLVRDPRPYDVGQRAVKIVPSAKEFAVTPAHYGVHTLYYE